MSNRTSKELIRIILPKTTLARLRLSDLPSETYRVNHPAEGCFR